MIAGTRNHNYKKAILKQLYFKSLMSCPEISARIGRSIPLTNRILDELVDEGLVKEAGFASSAGGRRPMMYGLVEDNLYILSVAMDQLVTQASLVTNQHQPHGPIGKFDLPLKNNPNALATLADKLNELVDASGVDRSRIIGVGIGMPGFIDVKKGVNHSFFGLQDTSITTYLQDRLDLPVTIDNDSSLIALAERRFGQALQQQDVMVININWGVGLGLILDGELYRGHSGFAGEFSHMPLFNNNKLCSCGKTGCLETETSLLVLIEKARKGIAAGRSSILESTLLEGNNEESYSHIISAALKGDQFSVELLSAAGYNIGRGIAILVHLLNPESIVLSGRGASAGKLWLTPIQQALNEHCIPKIAEKLQINISSLGFDAELIGAAALVMEHFDEMVMSPYSMKTT